MNRDIKTWHLLSQPSSLHIITIKNLLKNEHSFIVRWLTGEKCITEEEDKEFAILNSPINSLNADQYVKLNLLRIIARCLKNIDKINFISSFFLDEKKTISMIFTQEQQVKLFTEFVDNNKALLASDSDEEELFHAVAEFTLNSRKKFKEKALRVVKSGFSEHITIFFDDWDSGINIVCSSDDIARWFLDEPLSENLKILLGQRCSSMHTIAVVLAKFNLREYIIKFWNNGYDNIEDVQTLNEEEIEVLIKRVNATAVDAETLRAFLKNFKN